MDSDEPITPKADQRVIDGEVVGESQPKKQSHSTKEQEKPLKAKTDWSNWLPKTFTQKLILLVTLLLVSLIAYLGVKSTEQDWQVERINQLQTEIVKLKAASKELKSELNSLASNPENQPVVSQADVNAVKTDLETLKNTVQTELENYTEQLQAFTQSTSDKAQNLTETWEPSAATQQKMTEVEQNLKAKLEQMGQQLSELFSFKQAQQQKNNDLNAASSSGAPLSEMRLKQWIVEINTQWLLLGNVALTQHQLAALEAAASASDYQHKVQLAKLIGQDLTRLEAYSQPEKISNSTLLAQLREVVQTLPDRKVVENVSHETSTSSEASNLDPSVSGWQRLLDKAENVFSVRKRESETDLSDVETMMMHDVLIQRALLLVDRIEWALDSRSKVLLTTSQKGLNQFMAKHFPEQADAVEKMLAPLNQLQFKARSPLKIVEAE